MTCPLCGKTTDPKYRPFCSRRCADIDLGRWLKGTYVIPGEALEEADPLRDDAADEGPGDTPSRPH